MSVASDATLPDESTKSPGILGLLLAMAMFVLVVDTSLMNVSISAVVKDLGTTASGVQSAIALEALVSAAFILISSKVADLIGRRLAYVLGLLGYAIGALAMVLAQTLLPVIIFWAIFGGLGASLLLPSMQSLIHGNFEGVAQKKVYALVGASAAIAAAIGPLIGGFVTTFLSWRVGFLLELVVIGVVLSGIRLVKDVPYTGDRQHRPRRRRLLRARAWAASSWASSPGKVGRARPAADGHRRRGLRIICVVARSAQAPRRPAADRPGPFQVDPVPARHQRPDAAADRPGWIDDRAAHLSADGPRVQRPPGRPVTDATVAEHVRRCGARRTPLWLPAPTVGHDYPDRLRADRTGRRCQSFRSCRESIQDCGSRHH